MLGTIHLVSTHFKDVGLLEALRLLRQGIPPDYHDPWVALFYALWYQPGQIQLARQSIAKLIEEREIGSLISKDCRSHRVIDFGCGTLAMLFEVAIAASEAAEKRNFVSPIFVDAFDPSSAMLEIGKTLWQQFKIETERDARLSSFSVVTNFVESRYSTEGNLSLEEESQEERWLSGIHAVYSTNMDKIKEHLTALVESVNPCLALMTSHAHPDSAKRLEQVSPFEQHCFNCHDAVLSPQMHTSLVNITLWRRMLNSQMINGHDYLNGEVNWAFPSAMCKMYISLF